MQSCWKERMVKVGIAGGLGYSVVELLDPPPQHVQAEPRPAPRLVARREAHYVDLIFGLNEMKAPWRPPLFL
jgi:hypothetical protein